uniref:Uncharacterized protein n=1 Tax=Physcomitrium patens TaxID=3218 RepID=A0A2K1L4K3_PHYPA|nr:hypothetical protein PHYPA_003762 [Physcomitrium patens]
MRMTVQFMEMGYVAPAMVNYLALLGWNDGCEDEIFTVDQISGQHLRLMPTEDIATMFREQWLKAGIIFESVSGSFINVAMELLKNGTELVANSGNHFGELQVAVEGGHGAGNKWIKAMGKSFKRKANFFLLPIGKRLFMPVRVLLTGSMKCLEVGALLGLVREEQASGSVTQKAGLVPLSDRIKILRGGLSRCF